MSTRRLAMLLGTLAMATGCSDRELLGPQGPAFSVDSMDVSDGTAPQDLRVGVLGVLREVRKGGQLLLLYQTGSAEDTIPAALPDTLLGAKSPPRPEVRHAYAWGNKHEVLAVRLGEGTRVYAGGRPGRVDDFPLGKLLLVAGQVVGGTLRADVVTDLDSLALPTPGTASPALAPAAGETVPEVSRFTLAASSLFTCWGQDLDYDGTDVREFQGCWGGPSVADDINIKPDIVLVCPVAGCFTLDRIEYNVGVAGWGYAFPFRFAASASPGLVYHVPGDISLQVTPLSATVGSFSFWGGFGVDVGLNVDFCTVTGCYDVGTTHLNKFSSIYSSREAAPLPGQTLDLEEVACPGIGVVKLGGVPLDPLSVGMCADPGLNGRAFQTNVESTGATPGISDTYLFSGSAATARVTPNAMSVGVKYERFSWTPRLTMGFYLKLETFGQTLYETPSIGLTDGDFHAISSPFPVPSSVFHVAAAPGSPIDAPRFLFQPESANFALPVAPAPTVLVITSASQLSEGTAVSVRLAESYDNSAIANALITIRGIGLNGTPDFTVSGRTNLSGEYSAVLPIGEYTVRAEYAGATTYLPSHDQDSPVYVYRPTTFVIWGGNPADLAAGTRAQFWGSNWWKQVSGGAYGGNASFQGYAIDVTATTWQSPPASAGHGPASVPDVIGVLVTTQVDNRGSRATGNIARRAILRVESPASYHPNGGHAAFGVLRAFLP